jgi:hypothetical protein
VTEPLIGRLAGETLSSVVFVSDYCQLEFNGPRLSAYTWPHHSNAAAGVEMSGFQAILRRSG